MHTANVSSSAFDSHIYPVKARAVFFLLLFPATSHCVFHLDSVCSTSLFVLLFLLLTKKENQDLWFILYLRSGGSLYGDDVDDAHLRQCDR